MKITVYELSGLMLKRQAPKKIKVLGFTMNYIKNAHWGDYEDERSSIRLSDFRLNECLNDEVEIIEEGKPLNEIRVAHGLPRIENNFTGYKMYADGKEVMSIKAGTQENKIPEKLKIEQDGQTYNNFYIVNQNGTKCYLTKHSKMIVETLNQVIDYLKSKGE